MRLGMTGLVLCVGLGWTVTAQAQGLSNFMGRPVTFGSAVPNAQINNVPIDTSLAIVQFPQQAGATSLLGSFFHGFTMPSFPPLLGQSPLPAPSSFPSTSYPNAFQPLPPVIPAASN